MIDPTCGCTSPRRSSCRCRTGKAQSGFPSQPRTSSKLLEIQKWPCAGSRCQRTQGYGLLPAPQRPRSGRCDRRHQSTGVKGRRSLSDPQPKVSGEQLRYRSPDLWRLRLSPSLNGQPERQPLGVRSHQGLVRKPGPHGCNQRTAPAGDTWAINRKTSKAARTAPGIFGSTRKHKSDETIPSRLRRASVPPTPGRPAQ